VTGKLFTSLTVVSALVTAHQAAWAQTTPLPSPPPGPAVEPPPAAAGAPVAPSPLPAPPSYPPSAPLPSTAPPSTPPGAIPVQLMSLRIMRDKGIITEAEFESAQHDLAETAGTRVSSETSVVVGKWSTTLYGFIEADSIYDTTRSFNDLAGASPIGLWNTTAGANSRVQFSIRNSRLGFRLRAPEYHEVRLSGQIETDFLGTQLAIPSSPYSNTISPSPYGTENTYFSSPVLRVRHMNLKVETPVVDVLFGQYWTLFGWSSGYQPNTVEYQGVPGEVYNRQVQFRVSKKLTADPISVELAVAAFRPAQRDSGTPDGQAGLKFSIDSWTGMQTTGATGTQLSPFSLAVSGLLRHVAVNDFNAASTNTNTQDLTMSAIAVDGFIPVIPASKDNKDNAFSVHGEFTSGYGDEDMFTNLGAAGTSYPAIPGVTSGTGTKTYATDIDPGIVQFDGKGGLHGIQWTTYLFGGEYHLPGTDGKLFVSGNYSHMESANSHYYGSAAGTLAAVDWFDANIFVDPVPGLRLGVEYANFNDCYVNGIHAIDHRGQFSGFYIF
jgi:hypothetical protein